MVSTVVHRPPQQKVCCAAAVRSLRGFRRHQPAAAALDDAHLHQIISVFLPVVLNSPRQYDQSNASLKAYRHYTPGVSIMIVATRVVSLPAYYVHPPPDSALRR
eukprot:6205679-Pleurochrysis_carterae.AAC.3